MTQARIVRILGIRGVPAQHGGFETFADYFARYLVGRGWQVTVYCQEEGTGSAHESQWEGVRRVHIPVAESGSKGSVIFDGKAARHAAREPGLVLTLGYNTAFYNLLFRLKGIPNLMNMDGIEWQRGKWSRPVRAWFWLNEQIGCRVAHHLIADHPEMKAHLMRSVRAAKISVAAYGAEEVVQADPALLAPYGLEPQCFCTIIARPEPENSIREMVRAFSAKPRGVKLAVLGRYAPETHAYAREVMAQASHEVVFPGAIYDKATVAALRFHSVAYLHGHTVGGTNPSLLEALGAGNAVLAHDNRFNRWVAQDGALYFSDALDAAQQLDRLLGDDALRRQLAAASRARFHAAFRWDDILAQHEAILLKHGSPGAADGQ